MGLFSDNVVRLFEQGLHTIPCGDRKEPLLGSNWQRYCDELPTESDVNQWEQRFAECHRLGLLLGQASGIVAFDLDYGFDSKKVKITEEQFLRDQKSVIKQIRALLPLTPSRKVGKLGFTGFYKWNPSLANKNISCDRNGVRLFDFLNWHKQTIIPPSLHSIADNGKSLFYKWDGLPLWEAMDDLPELELSTILEIKEMFQDVGASVLPSRHKMIFDFIRAIAPIEKDEKIIVERAIAQDKVINQPPYLSDKKHHPTDNADINTTKWVRRILRWADATDSTASAISEDSWTYFFDTAFHKVKKDIVTGNVMIKIDAGSEWRPIENYEGALRTKARSIGLKASETADNLNHYLLYKKDAELLCDIPAWDGKDRLALMSACVSSPYFNADEVSEIFKVWGSNMFRRLHDPSFRTRALILKGPQNIGKDSLVRSMISDLDLYYGIPYLGGQEKDCYEAVSKLIGVHIEEFDQTQKLGIAFLKSLITSPEQSFRAAYARKAEKVKMRFSIITTANVDDILRDTSGNTRFIVLPIDQILFDYPRNESKQVLAQWKALAEAGKFKDHSSELTVKINAYIEMNTPEDISGLVIERYQSLFDAEKAFSKTSLVPYLSGAQCVAIFHQIGKELGLGTKTVLNIIKRSGCRKRTRVGTVYYRSTNDMENSELKFKN